MVISDIGVFQVFPFEAAAIASSIEAKAGKVFNLPEDMVDREALFRGIRRTLPLDPQVLGDRNWDALADSLWYGLHALNESIILIIWPKFGRLQEEDAKSFDIATELFADLCASLADSTKAVGRPKHLTVLQLLCGEDQ